MQTHSQFEICNTLQPTEKCVRLRKYNSGHGEPYTDLFHEHIPKSRMSEGAHVEMMKALVLRYMEVEAHYLLRCFLNTRGSSPEAVDPFMICQEYPEPGVIRTYCGKNVQAWVDTVILPEQFRK